MYDAFRSHYLQRFGANRGSGLLSQNLIQKLNLHQL